MTTQSTTYQQASSTLDWNVPKLEKLTEYDDVREEAEYFHNLRIKPQLTSAKARGIPGGENVGLDVIDLTSLQFSSAGKVYVPGQGILDMTPWASQQLGSELGVKMDKFFANMEPEQIQDAIMNHLHARGESTLKKVIARRHEEPSASSQGILRAFVSPKYGEIPDVQILDVMENTIGRARLDEMGFRSVQRTNRGTFMTLVFKESVNLLGTRGHDEIAYYGLRSRNSEVGAYSFTGDGYILKQVCTNGMIAGFTEDRWLYYRHRNVNAEHLGGLIRVMFERLVDGRDEIQRSNKILADTPIEEPADEIRSFLRRHNRPKAEQDAAIKALCDDLGIDVPEDEASLPETNAYVVMQGLARLGMASRNTPEKQHEIEVVAGDYMKRVLARQERLLPA